MFQSLISTAAPYSGSQVRAVTRHPQAFRGGSDAGDRSRDAHARAMADMSRNSLAGGMDDYRRQYQQRAEKARSTDLLTQRGIAQGQYELDRNRAQLTRQQNTRLREGRQEISQYRDLARKRAEQQFVNDVVGAIFGTNNAVNAAPLVGNALAGGARPFAGATRGLGGGGSGLFGMLMGGG